MPSNLIRLKQINQSELSGFIIDAVESTELYNQIASGTAYFNSGIYYFRVLPKTVESNKSFLIGQGNLISGDTSNNIFGGSFNLIGTGLTNSVVIGGQNNTLKANGNTNSIIMSDLSYIDVNGFNNGILFGNGNYITGQSGDGNVIIGGLYNLIQPSPDSNNLILNGQNNVLLGTQSFIIGGYYNYSSGSNQAIMTDFGSAVGDYASLIAGRENVIEGGKHNSIINGYNNYILRPFTYTGDFTGSNSIIGSWKSNILPDSRFALVLGGAYQNVSGFATILIGGYENRLSGNYSALVGGFSNIVSGAASTIQGGAYNSVYGNYSTIIGGRDNLVSGAGDSFSIGRNNQLFASGAGFISDGSNRVKIITGSAFDNTLNIDFLNGVNVKSKLSVNGSGVLLNGETINPTPQISNTTYSTLTGLKAANALASGQLYRISDFVLKWYNQSINDNTVKTAASGEPLIVTALSNKEISHLAQSETYPQDTIYYNINASGSYSWGGINGNNNLAIPNFKGWIYRRVDNVLNIDIPYDWRNITVNCCKPDVSAIRNYSGNYRYTTLDVVKETGNNINRGKLYYSTVTGNSGQSLDNINYWSPVSAYNESGTYFVANESDSFSTLWNDSLGMYMVELPYLTGTRIQQPTFTSTLTGLGKFTLDSVQDIKIENGYSNVFVGKYIYSNNIGSQFINNTIDQSFNYNNIGNIFVNNIIGNSFQNNNIDNYFYGNNIGASFLYNKILSYFQYNNIAYYFLNNDLGSNFINNSTSSYFVGNKISNYFQTSLVSLNFYYNNIGVDSYSNSFGINFQNNNIGNNFQLNTIGKYFIGNNIGNIFDNNYIRDFATNNNFSNNINALLIGSNFQFNTIESNVTAIDLLNATIIYNPYHKTIFKNSAGVNRLRYFNSNDQLVVTDPTA